MRFRPANIRLTRRRSAQLRFRLWRKRKKKKKKKKKHRVTGWTKVALYQTDDGPWLHSRTFYKKDLQLLQEPVLKAQEWFEKMELERGRKAADATKERLAAELRIPAQLL